MGIGRGRVSSMKSSLMLFVTLVGASGTSKESVASSKRGSWADTPSGQEPDSMR
ncbi:hypothetical protein LINGRAHAP2_LOCUS31184 [Linum grandiflorum]